MATAIVLYLGANNTWAKSKPEKRHTLKTAASLYGKPGVKKSYRQKLQAGSSVVVKKEQDTWAFVTYYMRYHIPKDAVQNGKITAKGGVNLRKKSDPKKILGKKLPKGARVWIISSSGSYYLVECPDIFDNGWISKSTLGDAQVSKIAAEKPERVRPAPIDKPRPIETRPDRNLTRPVEPKRSEADILFEVAEKYYMRISGIERADVDEQISDLKACRSMFVSAQSKAGKDSLRTACGRRIEIIDAQIQTLEVKKEARAKQERYKTEKVIIDRKKELEMLKKRLEEELANAKKTATIEYTASGWIEPVGFILKRPGTHRLIKGSRKTGEIWWLRSKDKKIDLNDFFHRRVGVIGKKFKTTYRGQEVKVIVVEKIDIMGEATGSPKSKMNIEK